MTNVDATPSLPVPPADKKIVDLLLAGELGLDDTTLLSSLSNFDLENSLRDIAHISHLISENPTEGLPNAVPLRSSAGTYLITQHALAFVASALIRSHAVAERGGNESFGERLLENLVVLSNIVDNVLVDPVREEQLLQESSSQFSAVFLRLTLQQLGLQDAPFQLLGRAWALFEELPNEVDRNLAVEMNEAFLRVSKGASIRDFLACFSGITALAKQSPVIVPRMLTDSEMTQFVKAYSRDVVDATLNVLSATIADHACEDRRLNRGLDPRFTKYRVNPLFQRPILRLKRSTEDEFIVLNQSLLSIAAFRGLYWQIQRDFETGNAGADFRRRFGEVINAYVGRLLAAIRPDGTVLSEFRFKSPSGECRFADFWYKESNRLFLFEVKSTQLTLEERTSTEASELIPDTISKIVDAIQQLGRLKNQIDSNQELAFLRGNEVHSFVITLDVPWVSAGFFNDLIIEEVNARLSDPKLREELLRVTVIDLTDLEHAHWAFLRELGSCRLLSTRNSIGNNSGPKISEGYINPFIEQAVRRYFESFLSSDRAKSMIDDVALRKCRLIIGPNSRR